MNILHEIKIVAINAAKEAGDYARSRCDNIKEIKHKGGPNDLVTDVDQACEKIVTDMIIDRFPEHSIIAEESGETVSGSDFCWVIDPIDGTTNFAHGFPFYCVSIGVLVKGNVAIGVVYDPSNDEMFVAEDGKGTFLNGKAIHVSNVNKVEDALVATGFAYHISGKQTSIPYFINILKEAQAVRRAGSAALDLCYVACGRFDAFWEFGLKPWDTAAGLIIVSEAGGKISCLGGESYNINSETIVATNARIHGEMINMLDSANIE